MSENTNTAQVPVVPAPDNSGAPAPEPKRNKFEKKHKRGMPKIIKVGIPLLLIGAILAGAVAFIRSNTDTGTGEIIEATAYVGTLSTYVTGSGSISPVSKAEYGADVKGEVLDVAVQAGDIVKKGDLLFTIDPSELKADLLKAREDLASLEKQLRDLDKNYENAVIALNDAQAAYNNTTLRAPFGGVLLSVSESLPRVGDPLSPGTVLATLADTSSMKLTLWFNRAYLGQIQTGQAASISVPENMSQLSGTVTAILDMQKPIDGASCFGVEIRIPNPGGLEEGQQATGSVHTAGGDVLPSDGGTLEYNRKEDLVFEGAAAKVTSVDLRQYASVSAGQVLCAVDSKPALDAVDEARYSVETYARQMSDDYIQNDIQKAQEKIAELQEICDNSAFYSTIDGQVSAVMIQPGDKLTASGTAVLTVSDTSSLVINANIDETDISNVKTGMSVDITYDTTDGTQTAFGTITYVSFEAKTQSSDMGSAYAYFPATITLENDGSLLPGMSVNYSILAVTKDSCLMLPSQCIINTEEGPVVYVKDDGQDFGYERVELGDIVPEGYYAVRVEIGLADENNTEIVSGLEEGTTVYQGTMTSDSGYWY